MDVKTETQKTQESAESADSHHSQDDNQNHETSPHQTNVVPQAEQSAPKDTKPIDPDADKDSEDTNSEADSEPVEEILILASCGIHRIRIHDEDQTCPYCEDDDGHISGRGEGQELRNPATETPKPELSAMIAGVKKCNWERFLNRFSDNDPVYVIEALVTGDELGKDMLNEATKRKESGSFQAAAYEKKSRVSKIYTNKTWIQRVRIQSPALLSIFTRVTGYAWGDNAYTFMRPFQYLIHFHDKFKAELKRLEDEASHESLGPGNTANVPHATRHLRAYIKFAEDDIVPDSQRFRQRTYAPSNSASKKIRFTDLWYLFTPGELMFLPEKTIRRLLADTHASHESKLRQRILRLYHLFVPLADPTSAIHISREPDMYLAYLYRLDYDGTSYRPVYYELYIPYFEGEKDIRDLDFYPLRFAAGADELLEETRRIGQRFVDSVKQWHMLYNGWTLVTDPMGVPLSEIPSNPTRSEFVDGEVIVDFNEAFNFDPRLKSNFEDLDLWFEQESLSQTSNGPDFLALWSDRSRSKLLSVSREVIVRGDDIRQLEHEAYVQDDQYTGPKKDPNHIPQGDDLALLPRRVFVFSLKESSFFAVDVRYIKPLDIRTDGFSRLQLPESHKKMIYSAVGSHLRRKRIEKIIENGPGSGTVYTQDFIQGKGRGLIAMLHGEPGIGKTATAEAVAQAFGRPLFPISCGLLNGTWQAEHQLGLIFHLAEQWDCILLLDEVDVFLSARTPTDDLQRNSLVSIFLRHLEYYNGILFLTTNRIGKIDQAISSRIHLMLHYSRLGKREIQNIFKINIDRLQQAEKQQSEASGEPPLIVVDSDILQFASDHCDAHPRGKGAWNGRQIRNAFIVAVGLARADSEHQTSDFQPRLNYSHFKQVERLMADYVDFRRHILGKNDSQLALLNEERDDDYEGTYYATEEEAERNQRGPFDFVGQGGPGATPGPSMFPAAMARSRMAFIPQHGAPYPSQLAGMQMGVGSASGMGMGYVVPGLSHQGQAHMASPPQPLQQPSGSSWMNMGHDHRAS